MLEICWPTLLGASRLFNFYTIRVFSVRSSHPDLTWFPALLLLLHLPAVRFIQPCCWCAVSICQMLTRQLAVLAVQCKACLMLRRAFLASLHPCAQLPQTVRLTPLRAAQ